MIDCLLETLPQDVRVRVWNHLWERAKAGGAIVVATASPQEAELCDRIAVLDRGSIKFVGTPAELVRLAGQQAVVVQAVRPPLVKDKIAERLCVTVEEQDGGLLFKTTEGEAAVRQILSEVASDVSAVYLRRPSLAQVLEKL